MPMGAWKRITDRYPFDVEAKGHTVAISPAIVILTSNSDFDDVFSGLEGSHGIAVKRRFTVF